jgi:hypothetical protein
MSGWKIVTRELYAAGQPLRRVEFAQDASGSNAYEGLRDAKALGLVECKRHAYTYRWHLTDKGKAWAEGGIRVRIPKPMNQGGKRQVAATWIAPMLGVRL